MVPHSLSPQRFPADVIATFLRRWVAKQPPPIRQLDFAFRQWPLQLGSIRSTVYASLEFVSKRMETSECLFGEEY